VVSYTYFIIKSTSTIHCRSAAGWILCRLFDAIKNAHSFARAIFKKRKNDISGAADLPTAVPVNIYFRAAIMRTDKIIQPIQLHLLQL
jgi:hypothetical protein